MFSAKDIFFFNAMLTPKIVTFVYWLALLGVLIGGIVAMIDNFLIGLLITLSASVWVRVTFEMIIIIFKNNEYLRKIAGKE